jgi:hypothetical protein
MINKRYPGLVLLIPLILFFARCAGMNRVSPENVEGDPAFAGPVLKEYLIPEGVEFMPAPFSWPAAVPGVGAITRDQNDPGAKLAGEDRARLTESFRAAFIDGLFRDLPLVGALGGDFVHSWPSSAPLAWVQNWQIRDTVPGNRASNSWGIPSLVLAIRGIDRDQAFIVRGAILDAYGKSAGLNNANGVMGYGAPRGNEFSYQSGIAQQFDYGLIHVDAAGKSVFIPNEVPAFPAEEFPEDLGYFPGISGDENLRKAFRLAWQRGRNENAPPLIPDGPLQRIRFTKNPWGLHTDTGEIRIRELYFQTFNRGSALILLAISPDADFQARLLVFPFADAFLADAEHPIPGTDTSLAASFPELDSPGGFADTLLQGLEFYGLPLTDVFPQREENAFRKTQRFSLGWMALY